MKYTSAPLSFQLSGRSLKIERNIEERITMMDKLVELVVFTPRGSFHADPDFGMDYWNYEYANVSDSQFNNNIRFDENSQLSAKERCEVSIAESIIAYAPNKLRVRNLQVEVVMNMEDIRTTRRKVYSHHQVKIIVTALLDDGKDDPSCDYKYDLLLMVEPFSEKKRISI